MVQPQQERVVRVVHMKIVMARRIVNDHKEVLEVVVTEFVVLVVD
jgi:hypothetical protein